MTTRKYYIRVPADFIPHGEPRWVELYGAKTLTAAQHYVDRKFGGHSEPEIGVSANGGNKKVIAKKNTEGKWAIVKDYNPYAGDQIQYHRNGPVSEEEFYNGFHICKSPRCTTDLSRN